MSDAAVLVDVGDVALASASTVRQFVPTLPCVPPLLVVGQHWPCWLSTQLSLRLPLVGGFFASRFHQFFQVPDTLKLIPTWSTVDNLHSCLAPLGSQAVLASGSLSFLASLEVALVGHEGLFAFAMDCDFTRMGL